jgi:nucleoporin SEH1
MDFVVLKPKHSDIVNDIVFNYYGKRFASCSSDKSIKIWTLDDVKGEWYAEDVANRAHQDSIWRLSWAHPEFGQPLASCSEDCSVKIWEEQESFSTGTSQSKWMLKATLSDGKKPVNDVKFSHRSLGLRLATACMDGCLRIYDARNMFDLGSWTLEV